MEEDQEYKDNVLKIVTDKGSEKTSQLVTGSLRPLLWEQHAQAIR